MNFETKKEKKRMLLVAMVSVMLFIALTIVNKPQQIGSITRKTGNSEEIVVKLENGYQDTIVVDVSVQEYTKEECDLFFYSCYRPLFLSFLAENENLSTISKDVVLVKKVEGYPFEITWTMSKKGVISDEGKIIAKERDSLYVYAHLSCQENEYLVSFPIQVVPIINKDNAYYISKVQEEIKKTEEETKTKESFNLPDTMEDMEVSYETTKNNDAVVVLLIGILTLFLIRIGTYVDVGKEQKKREQQILNTYPFVVREFVMYISSGLTIKNAWKQITQEGKKRNKEDVLFREMEITKNEMNTGISEITSLEHFEQRIRISETTRFAAILSQNLKNGSFSLSVALKEEAMRAFAEKKRRCITLGEEAGTKLLFPMILLLLVVMLVIMVPAFWSM